MEKALKIGDIVYLKGHLSPELSIYDIGKNDNVYCCWFDEAYKLTRDVFNKDQLENSGGNEAETFSTALNK